MRQTRESKSRSSRRRRRPDEVMVVLPTAAPAAARGAREDADRLTEEIGAVLDECGDC